MPESQLMLASLEDVPQLLRLEQQAQPFPWPEQLLQQTVETDTVFVLRQQQTIFAYAAFKPVLDEVTLLNTVVAPAFRRQGWAEALLSQALAEFQQQGIKRCFLEVRAANQAAIALYKKMQFVIQGQRKNYYKGHSEDASLAREDALLMMKEFPC